MWLDLGCTKIVALQSCGSMTSQHQGRSGVKEKGRVCLCCQPHAPVDQLLPCSYWKCLPFPVASGLQMTYSEKVKPLRATSKYLCFNGTWI